MTVCIKDITNLLDNHAIDYNCIRIMNLLGKLDYEDLEDLLNAMQDLLNAMQDLLNAMQDLYEAGEHEGIYEMEKRCQEHYDRGYSEGYNDGFTTEE